MNPRQEPPSRHVLGLPVIGLAAAAAIGVVVVAFFVVSPLLGSGDDESASYIEAVAGSPAKINPLFAYLNDADADVSALVFSGLTRIGPNGEVLPGLAETWEIDGTAVTFHLRDGVTWHTGVDFSSADVLFTYDLLADPQFKGDPDQGPLWRQISCSAPNDLTVICRLPQPFAPFLAYTSIGIVPKHILEGADAESLIDNPFNLAPIGTGPYRLLQVNSQRAVLQAFEDYYDGPPGIPEIELRFYPDASTAAASVIRGETQGLLLDSRAAQADFDAIAGEDGIHSYDANRSAYTALYLNNREAPINQIEVRQAIALAIDLDDISSSVLGERTVQGATPIVPGTWAYDSNLEPHGQDQDQARLLLEDSGWEFDDVAGLRLLNDAELRLSIMTDQDPIRGAVAELIASQLTEVGIAATVVRQQSTDLVRDFLIPRQYQAAIFTWDPGPDPDPYPAWHSSQITATGRNIAAYSNNAADKAMEDARRTTDIDERQRLYFTFQEQFAEDTPSVVLFYPVYTYFVTNRVEGIDLGVLFTPASRFASVHHWSLGHQGIQD
jgi:peptide/nickel transport system substrate-binding protein